MSDTEKSMECPRHDRGYATYICQHLRLGENLGYYHGNESGDLRPDAWCGDCDKVLMKEKSEWNERLEKNLGVMIICHNCYDEVRKRNTTGKEE
jgi:hypothetical protein